MSRPGPSNSIVDVQGLTVGCAEDRAALTGVTVIVPDGRAVCAADVRGGGPGTRETDALAAENLVDAVDAVVLAGGSVYGLAAADGVTAAMGAEGKGFALMPTLGVPPSPVIPAAILYDLANGGEKNWGERPPYAELLDQIAASGYSAVGRRHGVSDNAVRKWVRQYERERERERIEEERARRADRNGSSGAG